MLLAKFDLAGKSFRIEGTTHALDRMEERRIEKNLAVSIILSLGEKLLSYNDTGEEVAVIDQSNNLAIIIEVREYKAVVITVIDRANIHIKDGTQLEEIA